MRSTSLARRCGTLAVASTETRRPLTLTVLLPRLTATYRNNKTMPWVPPHFYSLFLVSVTHQNTALFSAAPSASSW